VAPRFLIDENLTPLLARHLRTAHGFDALHVQELGLRGASDAEISPARSPRTGSW